VYVRVCMHIDRPYIHNTHRYAILPYIYTLFHTSSRLGLPIMRPLWMEFPEDEETWNIDDQFMLGMYVCMHVMYMCVRVCVCMYICMVFRSCVPFGWNFLRMRKLGILTISLCLACTYIYTYIHAYIHTVYVWYLCTCMCMCV
jgi:hypothetical protein